MIDENTSFVGKFKGTYKDLYNQFIRLASSKDEILAKHFGNWQAKVERLAKLYIKWGEIFNLRPDIAWAQMNHETGLLTYTGDVKPHQNNFVGIGATGGVPGNSFATEELGVIAHYAHLAWYYFPKHVNRYCSKQYDPRHFGNSHYKYTGRTDLKFLQGQWAVPGTTYARRIADYANKIFISDDLITPTESISQKVKDALNISTKYNWSYITIHHTVSGQDWTTMDKIRQWHLARGFLREGYNFGVNGSGLIETGRPLDMAGAHVKGWNTRAIGIALYGDFRTDKLTEAQKESVFKLIANLQSFYDIPDSHILGHKEFSGQATSCPVIDMDWLRTEYRKFKS